ncbi:MAG: PepSY domain-containing protein [Pseudohongiellaceae bacterium]
MSSLLAVVQLAHAQNIPVQPAQIDINRSDNTRPNAQAAPRVTQRQAVEIARQRFEGNILRISLVGEGAAQRYQIRMEDEGKVFTVFVNVNTGRISGGG